MMRLLKKGFAGLCFGVSGWSFKGEAPTAQKTVFIAAPHTSNWDFVLLVICAWHFNVRLQWLGKHTIFKKPFGGFMRALGGVPVDRRNSHNLVDQLKKEYAAASTMHLAIPPAGTRSHREYWKSGFYHVATGAEVPVVFGFIDYARKEAGIGGVIDLTGDVRADMDKVRAFYGNIGARFPERKSGIRLRAEDDVDGGQQGNDAPETFTPPYQVRAAGM